jgi:hypothetical protein
MTNTQQKFKIIDLEEFTNKQLFLDFCKKEFKESLDPAANNMWSNDWEKDSHTLPNLIYIQNRFNRPNGQFNLLLVDEEIIGCAGVYISEFCSTFAIAGCRTWISAPYRNMLLVRDYFLPKQKSWAQEKKIEAIGLTFNSYNKNLAKIWEKRRLGEKRPERESHHMFYKGLQKVDFTVLIQNTPQWVIYEKINESWTFDWETIKCK